MAKQYVSYLAGGICNYKTAEIIFLGQTVDKDESVYGICKFANNENLGLFMAHKTLMIGESQSPEDYEGYCIPIAFEPTDDKKVMAQQLRELADYLENQ